MLCSKACLVTVLTFKHHLAVGCLARRRSKGMHVWLCFPSRRKKLMDWPLRGVNASKEFTLNVQWTAVFAGKYTRHISTLLCYVVSALGDWRQTSRRAYTSQASSTKPGVMYAAVEGIVMGKVKKCSETGTSLSA